MQDTLLQLFKEHPQLAIIISVFISIVIAVLGVLPSVFITATNIVFFCFINGTLISFIGGSLAAAIAFILYRKGFRRVTTPKLQKYPALNRLINAENKEAFYLVLSLRLVPFVPSGFITFAASVGKISFLIFLLASSLGKIPALLLEAWSVNEITQFTWVGKLILVLVAVCLLFWVLRKKINH